MPKTDAATGPQADLLPLARPGSQVVLAGTWSQLEGSELLPVPSVRSSVLALESVLRDRLACGVLRGARAGWSGRRPVPGHSVYREPDGWAAVHRPALCRTAGVGHREPRAGGCGHPGLLLLRPTSWPAGVDAARSGLRTGSGSGWIPAGWDGAGRARAGGTGRNAHRLHRCADQAADRGRPVLPGAADA